MVTGGSRGIGAAVCRRLAEEGAGVHCFYRSDDESARALAASVAERGHRLAVHRVDATDVDAVTDGIKAVVAAEKRLDMLVHCVGAPSDGLLLRARPASVDEALALNLTSAITACRAVLPAMLKAGYGRIVTIGSVVASMGNAGQTVYGAAKAGLEGFTRALAREVGSRGVTVNCVAPGFVETDLTAGLSSEARARALEATVTGRAGTAEEVAYAVAFLCDAQAGYVTGTVLHVNGGMYM